MADSASQKSRESQIRGIPAPRLLITAGPTHEPIDAVRYLANRSSGRMGVALAEAAVARGLETTLLLGPTHFEPQAHSHLQVARFRTTADLHDLLRQYWPDYDMLIMAAAVADFRPRPSDRPAKIQRSDKRLTIELEPTPDLLQELADITRPDQRVVGFALEPADRLRESARAKLSRKRLDAIVANPLETMDAEDVPAGATIFFRNNSEVALPPLKKSEFAQQLLDVLLTDRQGRVAT